MTNKIQENTGKLLKSLEKADKRSYLGKYSDADLIKAKIQARLEILDEIEKEINDLKNVSCVGMDKKFTKGSDWCNHLWKFKIDTLKQEISISQEKLREALK